VRAGQEGRGLSRTQLGGHDLAYDRLGGPSARPPLVLIHGYLTGRQQFRRVVGPLVEAGCEVVAPDLPGFGESACPPPAAFGYDGEAFADLVFALLDELGIESAILCGQSMGGAIALLCAARRPERVPALVLSDPLVYPFSIGIGRLALLPGVGSVLMRLSRSPIGLRRYFRRKIYADPAVLTPDWLASLVRGLHRPGALAAARATLAFLAAPEGLVEAARAVRAPTLILWGQADRQFPVAWADRLALDIPHARVEQVPDCGHSPAEDRPEAYVAAIVAFLDDLMASQRTGLPA
jgi:pimeloyl-ACP methyl ester carboxylesterase